MCLNHNKVSNNPINSYCKKNRCAPLFAPIMYGVKQHWTCIRACCSMNPSLSSRENKSGERG